MNCVSKMGVSIRRSVRVLAVGYAMIFAACLGIADDATVSQPEAKRTDVLTARQADANRWMVILCSLGGDEVHEERLTQTVKQIASSAGPVFGVEPEHMRVLLSSKEMVSKVPNSKPCNRNSLQQLSTELTSLTNGDSNYVFFVVGHSHLEGRSCQFNIEGPDVDQLEYAKLFGGLPGKDQVHWIGLPASGYWIKPLTGPGRTIITATEPDMEITATEMPYALGSILTANGEHSKLSDLDGDGKLTLMDLYLAVTIEVHQGFVTQEYLPTEHAQLDDNGDGRGTELQESFLPRKEGEPPVRKSVRKILDGDQARKFLLGPVTEEVRSN